MRNCTKNETKVAAGLLSLLIFFTGCARPSKSVARPGPQIAIDAGTLQGMESDRGEFAFLGIPYAAPPVGTLRWQPPQAPAPWQGVREATSYGPACPQVPSPWLPEMLGRKQFATDEACLYLNVWTNNLNSAAKVPVMVWIHGGGNVEGSQEMPPLGPTLAKHGVVVVSINYRLGALGFLAYPALSAESAQHSSGNYGLQDQLEALKWVRRNIDKFGGDPAQVTVFGASSGSLDICNLIASPLAAGYFQRAILQSGVCVDSMFPSLRKAEAEGQRFVRKLGVSDDSQALSKLRTLPADRILQIASQNDGFSFDAIVDGWFLREQPALTFARGKQANIPVMVGSNLDEVSIFASPIVGGKSFRPETVKDYRKWLSRTFKADAAEVFAAYPAHTDSDVHHAFLAMDTDYEFGFGSRLLAHEIALTGQSAFLYNFNYVGTGKFAALGAFHSEESMFLSHKYWATWTSRPEDAKLSETIIGYWTEFARTGRPDSPGLPPWPAYDVKTDLCQGLGQTIGQEPVPRAAGFKVFERMLNAQLAK